MLYKTITGYFEIPTEHINPLCGKMQSYFMPEHVIHIITIRIKD